ncbi:MAG: FixH family protein [Halioglobus sp.]|nr:FixH family protein [Halioglobus sp.]
MKSIQIVMVVVLVMLATTVSGQQGSNTPADIAWSKAWWNSAEKIQALSLSEQQRLTMEKHLRSYVAVNRRMAKEQKLPMIMLTKALADANVLAAREAGGEAAEISRDAIVRQTAMASNIVATLNKEQLVILTTDYPHLLAHFWQQTSSKKLLKPELVVNNTPEPRQRPTNIDTATVKQSSSGLYTISYRSIDGKAIPMNSIHAWVLEVTTKDDKPLDQAQIRFTAMMPEHRHGMNTRPAIRQSEKRGTYLVEGVNFHMPGWWVASVEITGNKGPEVVQFNVIVGETIPPRHTQPQE